MPFFNFIQHKLTQFFNFEFGLQYKINNYKFMPAQRNRQRDDLLTIFSGSKQNQRFRS